MTELERPTRVLIVAGSDSGGGAGVQGDIKTVTALGGYAATAITALTVQNTLGVTEVSGVDPFLVESQIQAVLEDIGADAIKIGMLFSKATVELVARQCAARATQVPIVVDPVIASSSGATLLDVGGQRQLIERLIPLAALVTPNLWEAEILSGQTVKDEAGMHAAADRLLLMGAGAVLITGGHLEGDSVVDLLRTADGIELRLEMPRVQTRADHGTGCALSSAIAVGLGEGMTLESAVRRAVDYVRAGLESAFTLGKGAGPLNHMHALPTTRGLERDG